MADRERKKKNREGRKEKERCGWLVPGDLRDWSLKKKERKWERGKGRTEGFSHGFLLEKSFLGACFVVFFFSSSVHVFHYIFTFMHLPCCFGFHSPFECDCYAIFSFSVISLEAITYMGSYASYYPAFFFSAIHVILNWWVHCWVVRLGTENAEWPLPKMCCEFPYYYC